MKSPQGHPLGKFLTLSWLRVKMSVHTHLRGPGVDGNGISVCAVAFWQPFSTSHSLPMRTWGYEKSSYEVMRIYPISILYEDMRIWGYGYEDIPAMQEELVMGRGYESVGSSENLVWAPVREWEKSIGRRVNLSQQGKINRKLWTAVWPAWSTICGENLSRADIPALFKLFVKLSLSIFWMLKIGEPINRFVRKT